MTTDVLDVIVVGGGHAGLSASYYLKQARLDHVVLERGQIGESWRSQRWDGFMLNSANKLNTLPGYEHQGGDPDGFRSAKALANTFADYASAFGLPVVENARVLSIKKNEESGLFEVVVSQSGRIERCLCRQVILASGMKSETRVPALADGFPPGVRQLHAGAYRHADQLPAGAVLVVGGAQSGCQIADDLADAGRTVYLSTSLVARVPRRYRGRDIMDWLVQLGFFDARAEDIADLAMRHMKPPQLTGAGRGQRTISLQALARKGVTLLGKLAGTDGQTVVFQPDAPQHVAFADDFSAQVKGMIDGFVAGNQLVVPAPEPDANDLPDADAACASTVTALDLDKSGITSVIWATGFGADFSYVHLPVFDRDGYPKHVDGVTDVEGLYFLGLEWLRNRKSALLLGIKDDARFIVETAHAYHKQPVKAA